MKVAAVISDLMLYSRIESAAAVAGAFLVRVDSPADLPDDLDLVLVDWSARRPEWADALLARTTSNIALRPAHRSRGARRCPHGRPRPHVGTLEASDGALRAVFRPFALDPHQDPANLAEARIGAD